MKKQLTVLISALAVTVACSSERGAAPANSANDASGGSTGAIERAPDGTQAPTGARSRAPASTPAGSQAGGPAVAAREPEAPRFKEVVIPAGTALSLTLQTAVSSDSSRAEDPVRATLAKPIVVDGTTAVPAGAEATGSVLEAHQSGRVKGRASVAFRFDRLRSGVESYAIHTTRISRLARATKGEDAKKVGIGAGAGAIIGAIAGGKKGAAIGGAVGAGAGTGVVAATRGEEVHLARGTAVKTRLDEAITILVPLS